MKALKVPFRIVGALVLELLLDARPAQATLDADAVVFVPDLETFEGVKSELGGFVPDEKKPYRLNRVGGGRADILPYSNQLARGGVLKLEPDLYFNMAGYDKSRPRARSFDWIQATKYPSSPYLCTPC